MPLNKARSVARRLRRFARLSNADRRLLARSFVALAVVDLGLRTRGFQRLIESAQSAAVWAPRSVHQADVLRAQRYARWLNIASRFHLVPAHCLHRSLALHNWLLNEGLPSNLRIGVRKEDGELKAHAWIELGGQAIGDRSDAVAGFKLLKTFGGAQPTWTRSRRAPETEHFAVSSGGALLWR